MILVAVIGRGPYNARARTASVSTCVETRLVIEIMLRCTISYCSKNCVDSVINAGNFVTSAHRLIRKEKDPRTDKVQRAKFREETPVTRQEKEQLLSCRDDWPIRLKKPLIFRSEMTLFWRFRRVLPRSNALPQNSA
jgi:hypothetical protein